MSKNDRTTVTIDLTCNECQNPISIRRLVGRRHKPGHIKHLYCFKCKADTAHTDYNCDYADTLHNMQFIDIAKPAPTDYYARFCMNTQLHKMQSDFS